MARFLIILLLCLLPLKATANWQVGPGSEIFAGTQSAFGVTDRGVGALGLQCRNGQPFLWTQGWAAAAAGADREESFQVKVDGNSFSVTGLHTPPDGLWTGRPPQGLINALKAGSSAVITTQRAGSVGVTLRGSSKAISRVLATCSTPNQARRTPEPEGRIVLFGQLISTMCGGGYTLAEGAEFTGRLDGDDTPDLILDWSGVTCDDPSKGRGAGFCGAALCTIEIALSQTQSRQQILGVKPQLVERAFGAQALKTTTQGATCGGPAKTCEVLWIWNGTKLEAQK